VSIVGSGALGSLFAAHLESQISLAMLSNWPQQIDAIRSNGLVCMHHHGSSTIHRFQITNNPRDLEPVDLALVLVKSYQTARAGYILEQILAADGLVITLQNGLGNFELLQSALGFGRVVQGVTAQGATMLEPGIVRHAGTGPTYIATMAGKREPIAQYIDLMNRSGLPAEETDDVRALQWGKLAINAGINALTAILRVRNGILASHETARKVMSAAAEETSAVARDLGIAMPYENASQRVIEVAEATADNQSSMLQDILRGAPTEINAINGAVAEFGRKIGIATPINDELWRLVSAIESNQLSVGAADIERLLDHLSKKLDENHDRN
jgi:2-dehydropantoate 2-reductase